ncbi:DNA-binding protein [Lactobacillus crispatus]|nr:DNA-binding protein [Lactobacillus crispatus]MBI1697786.1 DNA-binding protein [Lactobacillus crispatus]MBI1708176.1 DNA-binding protein [Lactobacillus crispatus]
MGPLKKGLTIKFVTPKLDKKYPLTINPIDKNQE